MLRPDLYTFSSERIVNDGWRICRDTCNMFFLIILLFIAFCTILQIDKYHAKKTLLTFIIMALLINFSKPIAIFIFDGAQLLMNYFLKANVNYETTVTKLSAIANIVYSDLPSFTTRWLKWISYSDSLTQTLFAIVFLFMYGIALIILGIYLFIRIVAMWILIIVSPFAFLAMAIPDFRKISSDWWEALFKYSYIGPAIAFFLYLSTELNTSRLQQLAKGADKGGVDVISISNFLSYITVLVFLYTSIIISQKFGIAFAGAITSRANKALGWGAKHLTGYSALKWGTKKGAEATGVPQAYRQIKADWSRKGIPIPGTNKRIFKSEPGKRRGAAIAEKLGVSGAYMGHIKQSADDLKNESDAAVQSLAQSGDAVAAYVASTRGILNAAILNNFHASFDANGGQGDEFAKTLTKNAKEKNQTDVLVESDISRLGAANTNDILENRLGNLTADQLGKQKLSRIHSIESANGGNYLTNSIQEMHRKATMHGAAKHDEQVYNSFYRSMNQDEREELTLRSVIP